MKEDAGREEANEGIHVCWSHPRHEGNVLSRTLLLRICVELLGYSELPNIKFSRKMPGKVLGRRGSHGASGWWSGTRGDLGVTVVVQTSEVAEAQEGSGWP